MAWTPRSLVYFYFLLENRKLAYLAAALPLLPVSRPALMRSRMASRSLSSLSLVMTTLEGWTPRGTDWPLVFSRDTRSTWITYLRR